MTNNENINELIDKNQLFITTFDNPYDYYVQYDEWLDYDRLMGYYTLEYLGRLITDSPLLSEEENEIEIQNALKSILEWNGTKMYRLIYKDSNGKMAFLDEKDYEKLLKTK